jgi:hypothetical protein
VLKRTWNKKYTKKKSSSQLIDEKIALLDREMRKTKLGESIANSTSGLYTVTGFEPGDPAVPEIPAIPAVPPTYENVEGGLSNPDDFVWEDQGDGSDPDAPLNIPENLYTTYNGEQVAAVRQIEGEYPGGEIALGYIVGFGWLSTVPVGYLTADGPRFIASVGVFGNSSTELGQKYQAAYNNWPFPGKIVKTIYFWSQLDCLFGTCRGASQYYPANLTNETTPKADRALYSYTLWLAADANGNILPNRVMTDPGSPEIPAVPGVPEGPPKPIVISRNGLGDPNYYPGPIPTKIGDKWGLSQEAYNQLISYDPYTGYGESSAEERKRNRELLDFYLGGGAGDPSSKDVQKQIQNLRNALKGV